ncbi:hypothetical protein BAE44_0024476, partial [Dichanthelium oligosanthes]
NTRPKWLPPPAPEEAFVHAAAAALAAAEAPVTRLTLRVEADGDYTHTIVQQFLQRSNRFLDWSTDGGVVGASKDLQALFDAAPELATVHLESVFFTVPPDSQQVRVVRLCFRAVTTLVLALCSLQPIESQDWAWAIEIDAPRLRSLVCKGLQRRFLLTSAAVELARFVQNFTNARTLRLKVNYGLQVIAALGKARRARFLCAFTYVERLELEGVHRHRSKTAAVAIANLLHCCPVLRDFRLKLSTVPPHSQI